MSIPRYLAPAFCAALLPACATPPSDPSATARLSPTTGNTANGNSGARIACAAICAN